MGRLLLAAAVAAAGLAPGAARANDDAGPRPLTTAAIGTANLALAPLRASRGEIVGFGPHATSVAWPSVTPPGWYTNTYRYAWYYPWYANYDFTQGPYANWWAGGGYAGYANHGPAGMAYSNKPPAEPYIGEWMSRLQEYEAAKEAAKEAARSKGHGPYGAVHSHTSFATLRGLVGCAGCK
jgi:hypothetical protein